MIDKQYRICKNCIMDSSDSRIEFDENGRCIYCNNFYNIILPKWNKNLKDEKGLFKTIEKIKKEGKHKNFDCIIGLSGGLDSSYLTYIAKVKFGLRPLLFHVDAGWNTDIAVGNIEKLVDGLQLDLYTEVINWEEMKDLQVAFLKSQIPHQDIPQDTAFFSELYKFARKHKVKYVLTGSNYSTECIREPDEWGVTPGIDKTLITDIHSIYGERPLKTFPIIDVFVSKIYYKYFLGMQVFNPLNFITYVKSDAEVELNKFCGWKKFKHKHHESRFTRFFEDYWLPNKFGFDKRRAHFSSLILTSQMTREDAIERIKSPELDDHFLKKEFEYVSHKLGLTVSELNSIFESDNKNVGDYKNKQLFVNFGSKMMQLFGLEKRLYK
ncbi:N-acetyl sugar amidotransferase [Candidatus Pelagibacter sp.]|nr:N-acetyl sugar amidotransferase [Candidatus Pelagibacter sp.]